MCECVILLYPSVFIFSSSFFFFFFFWLMIFFFLVSRCFCFGNAYDLFFVVVAVSFCCMHLHIMFIAVSNHCGICQMFFHLCFMYRHWGFSNKLLDLCACTATLCNIMHRHLCAR